jgi:hypothetical protein
MCANSPFADELTFEDKETPKLALSCSVLSQIVQAYGQFNDWKSKLYPISDGSKRLVRPTSSLLPLV